MSKYIIVDNRTGKSVNNFSFMSPGGIPMKKPSFISTGDQVKLYFTSIADAANLCKRLGEGYVVALEGEYDDR